METFRRVLKNPLGLAGLILVLFWLIIAMLAPILAPATRQRDPYTIARVSFSSMPKPPSDRAPFGTTSGGYDIFYGIVWGSRTAFRVGLMVVAASACIGVILGGLGAFIGGIVDEVVMRVTDLFMSFPFLIAVIVLSIVLGKGLDKVILALIIFGWRSYARIMRSEVLSVKEREFVSAAESIGASKARIFFRHVLPNAIFPVFVLASLDIGTMVLIAASLSFIGVGAEPGYADWGQMINFSRNWLLGAVGEPFRFWYTYTFPSLAILTFVLGWTLLGDTLRDVLDPKMRREVR
ncbi:ABC transporter permease subunit [candidate division KSB3 bacterium]|uniref:ABC transporter permease subunit n=1 Tax=candidate division KSB3 bacterium TaxID=2044937 RepID=A0A9D5Q8Q0_9BACT|nr:ABC transporter permease subunit [candidate division KSB3 bacterium]MBD3327597.1 ABC transporter permease subunit [candidate division KSB3 bacterium]